MRTISIELEDDVAATVDRLMGQRGYTSVSDLVTDAVRTIEPADIDRARLEALLLEGINSGTEPFTDADWDRIDREVERLETEAGGPKR